MPTEELAYVTAEPRRTFGRMSYSILGESSTASEKARRDAPAIAVCELSTDGTSGSDVPEDRSLPAWF